MNVIAEYIEPAWQAISDFTGGVPLDSVDKNKVFLGHNGVLDSIGLVTFISAIEDQIMDKHGRHVPLATPEVFDHAESPFKTLSSLALYVTRRLNESLR